MYYHVCDRPVYSIKIVSIESGISITSSGVIQTGKAKLSGNAREFKLECPACGVIKSPEEIFSHCMCCGKNKRITELYTLSMIGGVYCNTCIEEDYKDYRKFSLGNILSKSMGVK